MVLAVMQRAVDPAQWAAQYEKDRQAVVGLIQGLQGRIRELELNIGKTEVEKLRQAGGYEERLADLAKQLEEKNAQYEKIDRLAAEQLAKIKELSQAQAESAEEKEKLKEQIGSLERQLAEKQRQIGQIGAQCEGALARCETLQRQIIELSFQHQKQLDKNNEILERTAQALEKRIEAAQGSSIGEALEYVIDRAAQAILRIVSCKTLRE